MSGEINQSGYVEAEFRHVHTLLRTAILVGALAGGVAITVAALVRRHGVSAAAARDALARLEDEGLVGRKTADSAVVSDPEHQRFGDLTKLADSWHQRTNDPTAIPGSDFP
jgi:DNA-binding GntR family transcriptional regulator